MKATQEKIKQENAVLSNSSEIQKFIYEMAEEYSDCDAISADQNERRQSIREKIKEKGISVKAFMHEYQYYKLQMYEKDGYDDGRRICHEALNKAKNGDLFSWKVEKEAKKAEAKEKKAKAKDVGKAQGEAYEAAHGKAA